MLKKSLALAALLLAPLFVAASELPEYPFIHVTGAAMQYVLPDVGSLDFDVTASDADPAAARSIVEARVAEIQALVQEQGMTADDVVVRDIRQNIRKTGNGESEQFYQVRATVHINVNDLGKWHAITGGLLGKQNLDNFMVDFAPADKAQVDAELTDKAIKDAAKHAGAIAASLGRRLGPATAVTTGTLKNLVNAMGLQPNAPPRSAGARGGMPMDKADIINIVAIPFSQTVDMIYRIK